MVATVLKLYNHTSYSEIKGDKVIIIMIIGIGYIVLQTDSYKL